MKRIYQLFFLVFIIGFSPLVSAAPANHIIITEVEYNPSGPEAESEWFELFNPTNEPINISGWTIEEGGGSYYEFSGVTINSGEFLVVTNDTIGFNVEHPDVTPGVDMDASGCHTDTDCLRLNNTGSDYLILRNGSVAAGAIVDEIMWGTGGFASAGNGESICRNTSEDTGTDTDWDDDCVPSPGTGDYDFTQPNEESSGSESTSSGRSGSIRYVCKDETASNYNGTRFGRHKPSHCKYSEKENSMPEVVGLKCNLSYTTQLAYGSSGASVRLLQSCLNQRGFDAGMEDGIFGSQTEASVLRFQSSYGLLPNSGIADVITLIFLGVN